MKVYEFGSDDVIVSELGTRVARRRISQDLTQQALADEAGIAKRTLERIESGQGDARISAYIRIFRALDLLDRLELLLPEGEPSPMELLISARSTSAKSKTRTRVSSRRSKPSEIREPAGSKPGRPHVVGSAEDQAISSARSGSIGQPAWSWGDEP